MSAALRSGLLSALINRISEVSADPAYVAVLQERLQRHGAELKGHVPELLLRHTDTDSVIRTWLEQKDLSHWIPQSKGGTATQGWQFEDIGVNRSRGAEPMSAREIAEAHIDGGFDAIAVDAASGSMLPTAMDAAVLAIGISLLISILCNHRRWNHAEGREKNEMLLEILAQTGGAAFNGAAYSLAITAALALLPGAQIWLTTMTITSLSRALPKADSDPFRISVWTTQSTS